MKKESLPLKSEFLPLIVKQLSNSKFYLFASAVAATALYVIWLDRLLESTDSNLVMITIMLGCMLLYSLWQRRGEIKLESGMAATVVGIGLISLVLIKSFTLFWFEYEFFKLVPLLLFFGIALIASGFKGLIQYWRELVIVCVISLPLSIIEILIDRYLKFSVITTKFSAFLMWYFGINLETKGTLIVLSDGAVNVFPACTGLSVMLLMLMISVGLMLVFPLELKRKLYLLGLSLGIGFFMGVIRVAWLALVVSDRPAFEYWHGAEGAGIFSTTTVVVFGILCQKIIENNPKKLEQC
jgi:cyanoexosortase A